MRNHQTQLTWITNHSRPKQRFSSSWSFLVVVEAVVVVVDIVSAVIVVVTAAAILDSLIKLLHKNYHFVSLS